MNTKRYYLVGFSVIIAALGLLGLFRFFGVDRVRATPMVRYLAPGGNCGNKDPCYANLQSALDAAQAGDEILIAGGLYTGVNHALGLAQMAVITKTVTLRGGYAIDDWEHSLPVTRPTILDAQYAGRVFYITGSVSPAIENLNIIHGNAIGLRGAWRFGRASAGGGLYAISASVLLSNTLFDGNLADVGGGIYAEKGQFSLRNSRIVFNTFPAGSTNTTIGGGLFLETCHTTLENNLIQNNRAGYGGGFSAYFGEVALSQNRVQDNHSSLLGGGALLFRSAGLLAGNTFTRNSSSTGGGLNIIGNFLIRDNTISQNSGKFGGGIYISDGNITLTGNLISGNRSSGAGGGIALDYYLDSRDPDQKILVGNLISGNVAATGGGVFFQLVRPQLSHNEILANLATENGGGIFSNDSLVSMYADRIIRNTAGQDGGGVYSFQASALSSSNLILAENMAAGQGSALFAQDTSLDLAQATLADNPGSSGIYFQSNRVRDLATLTNVILAGHTIGITATQGSTVTIAGVLWFGNQADTGGLGTYRITHPVAGDPAFTSDYHIRDTSAARDAGQPSGIFLDIDTEPRPYGKFDLGADEFWPFGILRRCYLPIIHR